MFFLGNIPASSTVYLTFDTYDSNGASVTITGLAVTDIEIYKNGLVTQRSSDNGYALLDTDGIDFDGTTGLHGFSIDLSDNSDAGFYAAGAQYWVNVNAITVDAQTVRFTYYFRIVAAESIAGTPKVDVTHLLGTAWLTPAVAGTPDVNAKQLGGVVPGSATVGTVTTVTNQLTASQIATGVWQDATAGDFTVASSIGKALYIANVAPGGAGGLLISGSNAGTTTFGALTVTGAFTAGTNALPWNAAYDAEVQSECADALAAYDGLVPADLPANFASFSINASGHVILQDASLVTAKLGTFALAKTTNITGLNDLSAAQVNAEADTALSDAGVTSARMAELDAANLPADIDQIKADLPSRVTKNTALAAFPFKMVDATDHVTAETSLTVTATRSLDGAAFGACANAVVEVANGWYKIDLAAGDLNANTVVLRFTASGADTAEFVIVTQP